MTVLTNNFNGIASGTTITTTNSSGGGNAFGLVSGSPTAQSAAAYEGAAGMQYVFPGTSAGGAVTWSVTIPVGTRLSESYWFRRATYPTVTELISDSSSGSIRMDSSGRILAADTGGTILATSTVTPVNTWLFIQCATTAASTTTTGRAELVVTGDTGTTHISFDSGAAVNANTTSVSAVRFGRQTAVASAGTLSYDVLTISDALTSGFPGSPAPIPSYAPGQFFPFF